MFTNATIKNARFKLRIFKVNKEGFPDVDLLNEDIIVTVKIGLKKNTIDLSKYNLSMPDEGVIIAYEWMIVEENKYVFEYKNGNKKESFITYAPSLIVNEFEEPCGYTYRKGKWNKTLSNFNKKLQRNVFSTPAINLKLTN